MISNGKTPSINPLEIPCCDYELGCRLLYEIISTMLADPKTKKEYEEWENGWNRNNNI